MPFLTPEQIERIREIVRNASQALAFTTAGMDLTEDDLQRLVDEGLIDPDAKPENVVLNSYEFGRLMARLPEAKEMTFDRFERYMQREPPPLTPAQQRAYDNAKQHAGQYCVGLGSRLEGDLTGTLVRLDDEHEKEVREGIKEKVSEAIANKTTLGKLRSELRRMSGDWSRDWDRIAQTEAQAAHQQGWYEQTIEDYGDDALIAKIPEPSACSDCRRLYLENGRPKVRPASWWAEQGVSNVGRKRADWQAVLGPIHPRCQCIQVRVPASMGFDDNWDLVPKSRLKKAKDKIPGGLADKRPDSEFDADDLEAGIKVELEHTSDRSIAKEIAKDHLTEDKDYYRKLKQIEKCDCGACPEPYDDLLEKARKLHFRTEFGGLQISVENQKGSIRHWYDPHAKREGQTKMQAHYGYIRLSEAADGEHVDCYLALDYRADGAEQRPVFVVHQLKAPDFERYDEDKVILGAKSKDEARKLYLAHYDSPQFLGGITQMSLDQFRDKLTANKGRAIKSAAESVGSMAHHGGVRKPGKIRGVVDPDYPFGRARDRSSKRRKKSKEVDKLREKLKNVPTEIFVTQGQARSKDRFNLEPVGDRDAERNREIIEAEGRKRSLNRQDVRLTIHPSLLRRTQ